MRAKAAVFSLSSVRVEASSGLPCQSSRDGTGERWVSFSVGVYLGFSLDGLSGTEVCCVGKLECVLLATAVAKMALLAAVSCCLLPAAQAFCDLLWAMSAL